MFYDLNIVWPGAFGDAREKPVKGVKSKHSKLGKEAAAARDNQVEAGEALKSTPAQLEHLKSLVRDAGELGYHTIALSFIVRARFDPTKHFCRFPASELGEPSTPIPELDPRCSAQAGPSSLKPPSSAKVVQLTRMTLIMNDDSLGKMGHGLILNNQSELVKYDLLSAQPHNDATLSAVCLNMTELKPISIDIISIDAASNPRTPFFMKRSLVHAAISNGAVFEICYSRAVSLGPGEESEGGRDAHLKARRNIIAITRDLLRVSNGKGVILSSGAADVMGLRGPYDVINLATVFGMNATAARDAISSTCRSLLLRAETRKTHRGVVGDPVVVALRQPDVGSPAEDIVLGSISRKRRQSGASHDQSSTEVTNGRASSAKKRRDR